MWFKKKESPPWPPMQELHGFCLGQVVQHKVKADFRGVIIELYVNDSGIPKAVLSRGPYASDEFTGLHLAEIEPWQHCGPAKPVGAVDPHAQSEGKTSTRDA